MRGTMRAPRGPMGGGPAKHPNPEPIIRKANLDASVAISAASVSMSSASPSLPATKVSSP